jgi:pre-mRNA-splicing factor CWC26
MGKLDYLSKYTTGGGDETGKKSKKKEKKKNKKKSSKRADEVLIRDEDDHLLVGIMKRNDDDDEEEDDEDRPIVVDDVVGEPSNRYQQQEWKEIGDNGNDDASIRSDGAKGGTASPRRRYDSDDDSASPPAPKRRYDSDDSPASPKRRYDSDDDSRGGAALKRRYDSDDDNASPPRGRGRYESDDNEGGERRYGSDNDDKPAAARIKRSDSDADESAGEASRRKRYDSDDDDKVASTKRVKRSDSDDNEKDTRARMSSGHVAGLQQAGDFRGAEQEIQHQRKLEAQAMVDRHGMGETVYRDEQGRRQEGVPQEATKKKLPQLNAKEQAALNKGAVQKREEERLQHQFRELQNSSFARHADDGGLERIKKDVIRKGDPMAAYAVKKKAKVRAASGKPVRPMYKGPAPKPNRYGIAPGYRWDGVDRGNGFEDKALASKYSNNTKKEQAYRWSTSDM